MVSTTASSITNKQRRRISITGVVQGVGFRPHVYRLATVMGLTGSIKNNSTGVEIEIQGLQLNQFINHLHSKLPPLAKIDKIEQQQIPPQSDEKCFSIESTKQGNASTKISYDSAICDSCLKELFTTTSRYYRYPFINCTHCGPRYSIVEDLPYDRCKTSMAEFEMCANCKKEYENPVDRRFHAQPIACTDCGPKLSHSLLEISKLINEGKILAIKGLGGYQLICDAYNEEAIRNLRKRKSRKAKPFAIMVANAKSAKIFTEISTHEIKLLTGPTRPIILLRKRNNQLANSIAPGLSHLGVMLPCTPLHYLLFNALAGSPDGNDWLENSIDTALVVTSANLGGCPLITEDAEAINKLSHIADKIISYNRKIVTRVDDSVIRVINNATVFIRRARSFVPTAIQLPHEIPPTLALGAHLKNTVCMTRGNEAFVSQHIGEMDNAETIQFFHETIAHLQKILNIQPVCIAPYYHLNVNSTLIAKQFNTAKYAIQHHHAHIASMAAEYAVEKPGIGLAL